MMISKLMTPFPHTVGPTTSVEAAKQMMKDYRVRHLPVMDGGNLIGVLSERDLERAEGTQRPPTNGTIEDLFSHGALSFDSDTPLDEVCRKMAATKTECAMICVNRKLVGLFSWIDALTYFANQKCSDE